MTSFCGDRRSHISLLKQIRYLLTPGKGPTATGGFQDQKQLGSSFMFHLAKHTPMIWNQLNTNEKTKITALMKAHLLSSAFTSSDQNYYIIHKKQQRTMTGDFNQWVHGNPNYRNGIVGQVIIATLFLGRNEAKKFILNYDHKQFRTTLKNLNLTNLLKTYTSSDPNAPTASEIEWTVHRPYIYKKIPHSDLLKIYSHMTLFTYDRKVQCAANSNNVGIKGKNGAWGGFMAKNCNLLPNKGILGMLTEFDRWDGGGRRISAHYSNDGWYVNNYSHLALLIKGEWQNNSETKEVLRRMKVGFEDFLFKIDPQKGGGFHDFRHGNGYGPYGINDTFGHTINASFSNIIFTYHGLWNSRKYD